MVALLVFMYVKVVSTIRLVFIIESPNDYDERDEKVMKTVVDCSGPTDKCK